MRCLALLAASWLWVASASAAPPIRIAVAPFSGDPVPMSIAQALTGRLAERGLDRVIAPDEFIATATYEPKASEVRRWAYNSAVDSIIVGRVSPVGGAEPSGRRVETVLRSGHSGAELGRHEIVVPGGEDLAGPVDRLAAAILGELGYLDPASNGSSATGSASPVSASATNSTEGSAAGAAADGSASSGDALGLDLSRSGFRSEAPIEIKSDEAEIIDRENGRKLIFQNNVWVRQANVTLRSARLEASYRKGESEPNELIAEGNVVIVQEDRRAKCDRAVYRREANRLTCRGHAELIQGCDIVRGESIEIDLAGDQARVEGAASIVIQPEEDGEGECPIQRDPS